MILALRTDKPEAELYLYDSNGGLIGSQTWQAHRKLAETLLVQIEELLAGAGKQVRDLQAILVYSGPGSFTGLRIGLTTANTIAYACNIPIFGAEGEAWLGVLAKIKEQESGFLGSATPRYGSEAHITKPRK